MIILAAFTAFLATWLLIPRSSSTRVQNLNPSALRNVSVADKVRGLLTRWRGESKLTRSRREDTIAAVAALAAELRAGTTPVHALVASGGSPSVWPQAHAAALHHGDISAALVIDSRVVPELASLNACWRVGTRSGAGLAASVSRLAQSLREAQETRFQLETELAGPRATARMLAFLPLVGIGLGYLMGAQPLTWLISQPLGWATLAVGACLTALGVWWTTAIAAKVESML